MTERFTPREAAERDARLNRWLTQFHTINDYNLNVLRFNLRKSWEHYVREHEHSLLHDRAFNPDTRIHPRTENAVTAIRIHTASNRKWRTLAPLIARAGFKPVQDTSPFDEEMEHERLKKRDDYPVKFSMKVAQSKQLFDPLQVPVFSLDTVTIVNGMPVNKPQNSEEAQDMMRNVSGTSVTEETGWVFGMEAKSGASITLLNKTSITYIMRPISSSEIDAYVTTAPSMYSASGGIDLSSIQTRRRFIDMSEPILYYSENNYASSAYLRLRGSDLESPLFNHYFAGVPTFAINAFLPHINDIYLHGDPFY